MEKGKKKWTPFCGGHWLCSDLLVTTVIGSLPALIVYISVCMFPADRHRNLKQRLHSRPFDARVEMILAVGITFFHIPRHRRRHIVPVIRDVGIEVATVAAVMGNHFPTVLGAMIRKIGLPVVSRVRPPGIGGLGELLLEVLMNVARNVLIFISALAQGDLAAGRQ